MTVLRLLRSAAALLAVFVAAAAPVLTQAPAAPPSDAIWSLAATGDAIITRPIMQFNHDQDPASPFGNRRSARSSGEAIAGAPA